MFLSLICLAGLVARSYDNLVEADPDESDPQARDPSLPASPSASRDGGAKEVKPSRLISSQSSPIILSQETVAACDFLGCS